MVSGWYITDNNRPVGKVLFTTTDFQSAAIDSIVNPGSTTIRLKLKPDMIKQFRDISEQTIGKNIGFAWNDSVICAIRINTPIESGNMQIISRDKRLMQDIYESINIK